MDREQTGLLRGVRGEARLCRNSKRPIAYSVIEPITTVPTMDTTRMTAVLADAVSMRPLENAVA